MTKLVTRPLSERPVERFYLIFFGLHIVTTLIMDSVPVFYQYLPIPLLKEFNEFYINTFKDPIMSMAIHHPSHPEYLQLTWFRTFLWGELFFQCPVFIYGIYSILKDEFISKFSIIGIIYSSHVITTVLPVLNHLLFAAVELDFTSKAILFGFYFPFLLIPLHLLLFLVKNIQLNNSKVKSQ